MTELERIKSIIEDLNEKEKRIKEDIAKRKERINKLNAAKKALMTFSKTVESGKMESILRCFAEE